MMRRMLSQWKEEAIMMKFHVRDDERIKLFSNEAIQMRSYDLLN